MKKSILILLIVLGIAGIAGGEDFFPMVNLIWDHAGDGQYVVDVQVVEDNGKSYDYQMGPQAHNFNRIDVDPNGFYDVSIFSGGGVLLYNVKFRLEDLAGMERSTKF